MKILALAVLVVLVATPAAPARTWTDSTGKFKIEAELLEVQGDTVRLRRTDGRLVSVPLSRLSAADQAHLEQHGSPVFDQPQNQSPPTDVKATATARWSHLTMFPAENNSPTGPPLEIMLTLTGPSAEQASAYGQLKLLSVVGSDGQKLKVKLGQMTFEDDGLLAVDRSGQPQDGLQIPIHIQNPASPLARIDELRGTLTLRTGGTYAKVAVPELNRKLGESLNDATLKKIGIEVQVRRRDDNEMKDNLAQAFGYKEPAETIHVEASGNLQPLINVQVLDGGGKPLDPALSSGGGSARKMQYSFGFEQPLPDDAQLELTLHLDAKEVEVPFALKGIEVPPIPDPNEGPLLFIDD